MYKHCKRHIMLIYQSLVAVPPLHLKLPFNSYRYYATKYSFRDYKELYCCWNTKTPGSCYLTLPFPLVLYDLLTFTDTE